MGVPVGGGYGYSVRVAVRVGVGSGSSVRVDVGVCVGSGGSVRVGVWVCVGPGGSVPLQAYGAKGGGHHVLAKSRFLGAKGYDENSAFAISNATLEKLGIRHSDITVAQGSLYREFAKTGRQLTWNDIGRIETEALHKAGMDLDVARSTVHQAIRQLKDAGVTGPTRTKWGR